nr:reverse transcriptase domain-containing protein [Tanacetum cinerariifolium]
LKRRDSIEYASEMELECAKVRGDFLSYKMEFERSCDKYTQTINDLNQTISEMKNKLSAHQDTISILKQQKEAQIKLYKTREDKEIEKVINLENKVKRLNEEIVGDLRYFNSLELEVDSLTSQLETQKTQFVNEIDRLSREYYCADHMNAILGVYTELDEVTNLQCHYLGLLQKYECLETELSKSKMILNSKTLNVKYVSAMCDKCVMIDKHDLCVLRYVHILKRFKASIIPQQSLGIPKAITRAPTQKEQNLILRNITAEEHPHAGQKCCQKVKTVQEDTGSQGRKSKDQASRMMICLNHVHVRKQTPSLLESATSNYQKSPGHQVMSKRMTEVEILKIFQAAANVERWAMTTWCHMFNSTLIESARVWNKQPIVVPISTREPKKIVNQSVATSLKKTVAQPPLSRNLETSLGRYMRVIIPTSVSRPQLKSNQMGDRVMPNNSQEKKQQVEDHRKNFKFSNNKTLVTALTAQTLPKNKKPCLKNANVLAHGMYKIHTDHTRTRTSQLPQDSKKTNKRVSFSTGVILTTSVSRPQLKSNPLGDRVMHNNSQRKKKEVEYPRRSVKLSKNKTSVTACNDSLNAKTLNVKSVSAMCDKCVLIDKHDMCVLKSVTKPLKNTVASESNKKPRNNVSKLHERFGKIYKWSYIKFTPSGYMWKPKSPTGNVNPNKSRSKKQRFKVESRHVKRTPKCMRIFGFMHGITNPRLIKHLHDNILKSMDEMMRATTAFLKGEVAASNQARKKTLPAWKQ